MALALQTQQDPDLREHDFPDTYDKEECPRLPKHYNWDAHRRSTPLAFLSRPQQQSFAAFARMKPFEIPNIAGMSDVYTTYLYVCQERPSCENGCQKSDYLFCSRLPHSPRPGTADASSCMSRMKEDWQCKNTADPSTLIPVAKAA